MATSTDTDFLSLAHLTLKVNYKREFKTCSQQRSDTRALQTPLITFLVSTFPLFLTPRTLILVEGSHVSTWNHLQPPRDDEGIVWIVRCSRSLLGISGKVLLSWETHHTFLPYLSRLGSEVLVLEQRGYKSHSLRVVEQKDRRNLGLWWHHKGTSPWTTHLQTSR